MYGELSSAGIARAVFLLMRIASIEKGYSYSHSVASDAGFGRAVVL